MESIAPLFRPQTVAVVGASRDPNSIPGCLFANLHRSFSGAVYPVNPIASTIQGVHAYASVLEISGEIDLAFIAVPVEKVFEVACQCVEKAIPVLVVISAGFSEKGDLGAAREQELVRLTRPAGVRLLGPNCVGIFNTDPAAPLKGIFSQVVATPGNVALGAQSGAFGLVIPGALAELGVGISSFVSLGNKADITENDLLDYWQHDRATRCIALYLESFQEPRGFLQLTRQISRHKPVVVLKGARTPTGSRAASSHTAALTNPVVAAEALMAQTGVVRTDTIEEMYEAAALLANQPIPCGSRVAAISNAGGPAVLCADVLESGGLNVVEFSPELRAQLQQFLPQQVTPDNPLDLVASVDPQLYQHCLELILGSCEVDAAIAIFVPRAFGTAPAVARAVRTAAAGSSKPVLAVFAQADPPLQELRNDDLCVPCYRFPEPAAMALVRAVRYGQWRERPAGRIRQVTGFPLDKIRRVLAAARESVDNRDGWLGPMEVQQVISTIGLPQPKAAVALTPDEAVQAARQYGGPVALKVISPTVLHKSDVGGVVLDVEGDLKVKKAFQRVSEAVTDARGVLVQQMVQEGEEVLIGTNRDPLFGPLVVFGLGGTLVELLESVAVRLAPMTDRDAEEAITAVRGRKLLDGYRGRPPADVAAIKEALLRVSAIAEALPELAEMDLNPIKVLPKGRGIRVVDARIRLQIVGLESLTPKA